MNISLGAEFEKRINEKLASGLYTSASEVIRDALRLLFERDLIKQQQFELLQQEVLRGVEQLSAGHTSSKNVLDIFSEVEQSVHG